MEWFHILCGGLNGLVDGMPEALHIFVQGQGQAAL